MIKSKDSLLPGAPLTSALGVDYSEGTGRNHVSSIRTKLDGSDQTQAAIIAGKYGLDK